MKLALARAMLQKADILLMDEPTNHLDVINVKWVKDYLLGLTNVTCIMVSHDSGLLNEVCNNIMAIKNLKLHQARGNLEAYVKTNPDARSFFELKTSKFSFKFPQPGPIKGVNNKGKFLMKMDDCTFTYPGNETPTIRDITVRVSLGSRVACLGVNGAGKSTMIKILTGELVPQTGNVWKHPSARVAYVAQHAFHHIEKHLNKTPNEYIRWRYESGDDKETLVKESMTLTEEEEKLCKQPVEIPVDTDGKIVKLKRIIDNLTGARKEIKGQKEPSYECKFNQQPHDANLYLKHSFLVKAGFEKHMKAVDEKIAIREGFFSKPLTSANVEQHICDVGLEKEYATHTRMSALSGGQKVKVVLAAAMWNQPHILILDEPTNYLDRDSLGALSGAIEEFGGGVVMITHNNEFCSKLCPETWLLQGGRLDCQGDAQWMENVMKEKVEDKNKLTEMVDGLGNTIKLKNKDKKMSRKEIKAMTKQRKAALDRGEDLSDDEDWDGSDYIGAKK
jgi:elongation factor 3